MFGFRKSKKRKSLADDVHRQIKTLCSTGDELAKAATWILAAIGDANFLSGVVCSAATLARSDVFPGFNRRLVPAAIGDGCGILLPRSRPG
jgi:hypothetical protein